MGHLVGPADDVSTVDKRRSVMDFNGLIVGVREFLTFGQRRTPAPVDKNFQ
jgi:hypothetical protein